MAKLLVNNTSFEIVEHGGGEKVILVHGSASDLRTWNPQLEEFQRKFRVVAYSRRHHWPNEPISKGVDYSMVEHLDDLEAVVRHVSDNPCHLIGHSYGAFLCLLLAIRQPSLLKSLVLSEPPVLPLFVSNIPKPSELLRLLVSRPPTALAILKFGILGVVPAAAALKKGNIDRAIKLFGTATLGRKTFQNLSNQRMKQVRDNFIEAELLGSGFAPVEEQQIRSLYTPTLLMTAQRSPRLFHCLAKRLRELLPDFEAVTISSASHIMHEDNPEEYNAAVLAFLSRQSSAE